IGSANCSASSGSNRTVTSAPHHGDFVCLTADNGGHRRTLAKALHSDGAGAAERGPALDGEIVSGTDNLRRVVAAEMRGYQQRVVVRRPGQDAAPRGPCAAGILAEAAVPIGTQDLHRA